MSNLGGAFSEFKNIIKLFILSVFVYLLVLSVITISFSHTIGIEVQLTSWFIGISFLSLGIFAYAYQQPEYQSNFKKYPRYVFILGICATLVISATMLGLIKISIFTTNEMMVGVSYWELRTTEQNNAELQRIYDVGFRAIRVYHHPISYPDEEGNIPDNFQIIQDFLLKCKEYGFYVVMVVPEWGVIHYNFDERFVYYFKDYVDCWQIGNEVDNVHWTETQTYPMQASEVSIFMKEIIGKIKKYDADAKTLVTFTMMFPIRANFIDDLVAETTQYVDYVGLDVYPTTEWLAPMLTPEEINFLRTKTQKEVWITEVGIIDEDQNVRAQYFKEQLDLYKRNGISKVFVFSWEGDLYGVRDTESEVEIKNWIGENL